MHAAREGNEGIVKILLGREGANLDRLDKQVQTPLSFAARNGINGVVKILLGRGEVNSDNSDNYG